jgi:hypothetical protein
MPRGRPSSPLSSMTSASSISTSQMQSISSPTSRDLQN